MNDKFCIHCKHSATNLDDWPCAGCDDWRNFSILDFACGPWRNSKDESPPMDGTLFLAMWEGISCWRDRAIYRGRIYEFENILITTVYKNSSANGGGFIDDDMITDQIPNKWAEIRS